MSEKPKRLTTDGLGPLLDVENSKSACCCGAKDICTSKVLKLTVKTAFGRGDVEKVHSVAVRGTFASQKCQKVTASDHFWTWETDPKKLLRIKK